MTVRSQRGARQSLLYPVRTCVLLLLACSTSPSRAQSQLTTVRVEVGGSRVRYADTLRTTAISVTPEVIAEWPLAVFRGSTSFARLSEGGTSVQGAGGFSLYTPPLGRLMGELEVYGGGTRSGGITTSQVVGIARGHLTGSAAGLWIGGGGGTADNGIERRPSVIGDAGAWAGRGAIRASVSVTPTVVDDTIRYTDVNFAATATARRVELTATAGSRSGTQPQIFGTTVKAWASASLVSWLASRVALVAGAGRYPVDFTQGFPGGTYASVGLRVAARYGAVEEPVERRPTVLAATLPPDAPVSAMQVNAAGGLKKLIFFRAAAAQRAEIAGEFTDWQPLQMTRRPDGWWSIELDLETGRYETSIRLDGGSWQAPPGLLVIRDEFGGEVGLLDVP